MNSLAPLESIRLCILLALSKEPLYGYKIQQQIATDANDLIHIEYSTIYKALKRLEQNNDIKQIASKDDRQILYQLTPQGRRTLKIEMDRLKNAVHLIETRLR